MKNDCETCNYRNIPQKQGDHCFKFSLEPTGIQPCSAHSKYENIKKPTYQEKPPDGYTQYLLKELQDPENMIAYIEAFLEDSDVDVRLLKHVLYNIKLAFEQKKNKMVLETVAFRG